MTEASSRSLRPWVAYAVPLLFFASFVVWSLATPVMGVPDEPAHTIKAASIWHGQLRGEVVQIDSGDETVPIPISYDQVRVPASYAELPGVPACYAANLYATPMCAPDPGGSMQMETALTAAGPYPPLYYVLVGWPARWFGADVGTHLMRITGAAWCAALLGVAFAALRRLVRPELAFVGIALAATPMVHFLAGAVNPNGFEVAAAIAFWCTALAVVVSFAGGRVPARSTVVGYLLSGAALALSRSLSPAFAALILASVLVVVGWRGLMTVLRRREWWLLNLVLAVPVVAAAVWILTSGHAGTVFGARPPAQRSLFTVLGGSVDDYLFQALAVFGWKDTGPVVAAILPWIAATVVLLAAALFFGSRWRLVVLLGVLVGSLAMPVVAQWPSARSEGLAWQGRYQLPLLVGVPLLAAWIAASFARRFPDANRRLVWSTTAVVGGVLVVCHVVAMQRNVSGLLGPLNYLSIRAWTGPASRWVLLLATLVVAAG
ncbi:MAG: DUF2142 domain-containing protein, partial [Microthrixaceae bacterium]